MVLHYHQFVVEEVLFGNTVAIDEQQYRPLPAFKLKERAQRPVIHCSIHMLVRGSAIWISWRPEPYSSRSQQVVMREHINQEAGKRLILLRRMQ